MLMRRPRSSQRVDRDKVGDLILSITACRNLVNCARPFCVLKSGKKREKTSVAEAPPVAGATSSFSTSSSAAATAASATAAAASAAAGSSSSLGSGRRRGTHRSIHDDPSVNPKFGNVFRFPVLGQQLNEQGRIHCRIEVRDDRNKLTYKAAHAVGGYVDLQLDRAELMDPMSPFRDRWWLLEGVDNGEIHIQASYISAIASPRKAPAGPLVAEDGIEVEGDHESEAEDMVQQSSTASPRTAASEDAHQGSSFGMPSPVSPGTLQVAPALSASRLGSEPKAPDFFSKLASDLKTGKLFQDSAHSSSTAATPRHTEITVHDEVRGKAHVDPSTRNKSASEVAGSSPDPLFDHWGFIIDPGVTQTWRRLESYVDLRQQRQMALWDRLGGLEIVQAFAEKNDTAELQKNAQLFWNGVPEHLRKHVYMMVRGAARRRAEAPNTYDSLLERVRLGELDSKTSAQIETDLPRTFAGMRSFVNSEDGSKSLRSVLSAFALHNTVVRYCQGMNLLTGFILCNFPEESSFWILSCLTESIAPAYYVSSMQGLQKDIAVVNGVVADHLPTLLAHMDEVGMPLQPLLTGPILSMFVGVVPATTVARIFDILFVFGTKALLAASLAVLELGEEELLTTDGPSEFQKTFKSVARRQIDADFFISRVKFLLTKYDRYISEERTARNEESDQLQFKAISSCREVVEVWGGPVPEATYETLLAQFLAPIGVNNKVPDYQHLGRSEFLPLLFNVLELPRMEDPGANINPLAIATPGSAAPTPAVVRRRTSQNAFSLKSAVGYSARFPFTLNFFDTVGPDESNRLYDDFCLDKETRKLGLKEFVRAMGYFAPGVGNGIKKLEFCTRFASYATDEVNAMPRDRSPLSCSSDKEQSCSPGRKSVCPAAQLTDWCDVQTFLKWAWVVFQLDLLQLALLDDALRPISRDGEGFCVPAAEVKACLEKTAIWPDLAERENSVKLQAHCVQFDVEFGSGSLGLTLKGCQDDLRQPSAARECWILVKAKAGFGRAGEPKAHPHRNYDRIRPGSFLVGSGGDLQYLSKPLSAALRDIKEKPRPITLTFRNYYLPHYYARHLEQQGVLL